jgi:hypothetical protein
MNSTNGWYKLTKLAVGGTNSINQAIEFGRAGLEFTDAIQIKIIKL